MGDVLDDRDCHDGDGARATLEMIQVSPRNYTPLSQSMGRHIQDLKAEVSRLRAQKPELTETQRGIIDAYQAQVWGADNVHWLRCALKYTVDIINGLCPPKAPPTLAELADKLERITYDDHAAITEVIAALRARGDK